MILRSSVLSDRYVVSVVKNPRCGFALRFVGPVRSCQFCFVSQDDADAIYDFVLSAPAAISLPLLRVLCGDDC